MGDKFQSGGTNNTPQVYADSDFINHSLTIGGNSTTIINESSFSFSPSVAGKVNFYGNLSNSGTIDFDLLTSGVQMGQAVNLASPTTPTVSLHQVGGSITYDNEGPGAVSNPTFNFNYAAVTNDADSTIDIESSTGLNMAATYVEPNVQGPAANYPVSFSNAGTVKISSGTGGKLAWGLDEADFTNSGNFSAYNMAVDLHYKNVVNSGTFSIDTTVPVPSFSMYVTLSFLQSVNFSIDNFENKPGATFSISNQSGSTYTAAFNNFHNDAGGTVSLTNTSAVTNVGITNDGSIYLHSGSMIMEPGSLGSVGSFSGTGTYYLENSTFQTYGAPVSNNLVLTGEDNVINLAGFNSGGPTLSNLTGTIRGFGPGDELILTENGEDGDPNALSYNATTGILHYASYNGYSVNIDIGTGYTEPFHFYNGAVIYGAPLPCFAAGTSVLTASGEKLVEELHLDDMIITASGKSRRIVWLGHRSVKCVDRPTRQAAWPYRVRAYAFGENLPARDLYLSPDHAVMVPLLSEVLIPIKHLDNGATIAQVPVDEVTYWHVELESHDLLLAENLPAESFLDTLGRDFFERQGFEQDKASFTTKAGRPHLKNWEADACRPLVTEGAIVAAARQMLLARAQELGWTKTQEADLHMLADGVRIEGRRLSETTIRFTFPAATRDLQLASRSFVPRHGDVATLDERRLGVPVASLVLRQRRGGLAGLAARLGFGTSSNTTIALDGPGLVSGFHPAQEWEGRRWRWTNGAARLSPSASAGLTGTLTLDVELAPERGTAQVWMEPAASALERAA